MAGIESDVSIFANIDDISGSRVCVLPSTPNTDRWLKLRVQTRSSERAADGSPSGSNASQ